MESTIDFKNYPLGNKKCQVYLASLKELATVFSTSLPQIFKKECGPLLFP
jgi:hypothetical protein